MQYCPPSIDADMADKSLHMCTHGRENTLFPYAAHARVGADANALPVGHQCGLKAHGRRRQFLLPPGVRREHRVPAGG